MVLSPRHGQVSYKWEYRIDDLSPWQSIAMPAYTCLLYVKDSGEYKCTIEDSSDEHLFTVCLAGMIIYISMQYSSVIICVLILHRKYNDVAEKG